MKSEKFGSDQEKYEGQKLRAEKKVFDMDHFKLQGFIDLNQDFNWMFFYFECHAKNYRY